MFLVIDVEIDEGSDSFERSLVIRRLDNFAKIAV